MALSNRPILDTRLRATHNGDHGAKAGPLHRPIAGMAETEEPDLSRRLTEGETEMVKLVFKNAIKYSQVRVHRGSFLPFNLQSKNTAMAPNGEIYFLSDEYRADFSVASNRDKWLFLHEFTHVWQYHLGYPVAVRGAIRVGLSYAYEMDGKKKLGDYNMEAQGDLIADYFSIRFLNNEKLIRNKKPSGQYYSLEEYEKTLSDFIADPSNKNNLP